MIDVKRWVEQNLGRWRHGMSLDDIPIDKWVKPEPNERAEVRTYFWLGAEADNG